MTPEQIYCLGVKSRVSVAIINAILKGYTYKDLLRDQNLLAISTKANLISTYYRWRLIINQLKQQGKVHE